LVGSLRSEGSQNDQVGEAGPFHHRPRVSKLLKEDYQARVLSDQIVLMIARWEADQCECRLTQEVQSQKILKQEMEKKPG
jgi:hypothetical protein